jgi:hypothetical protein
LCTKLYNALLIFISTLGTTSCQACTGQRLYDPQGSSSYSTNNQPWHIKYGDLTEASGIVFSDTVDIGGIQIKNLPMYAADKISQGDPSMDGLMGLGFDSGATVPGVKTPFEVMVENKLISSPIFGVYLGKTINQIQGTGGMLVIIFNERIKC